MGSSHTKQDADKDLLPLWTHTFVPKQLAENTEQENDSQDTKFLQYRVQLMSNLFVKEYHTNDMATAVLQHSGQVLVAGVCFFSKYLFFVENCIYKPFE